jgi:GNAT superfamily N-acetyltransferase
VLTLRPAQPDDEPFLYRLYCSTRQDEMDAWGWGAAQREAFLQLQFRAQRRHYETQATPADHQVICQDGSPIGQMIVIRKAEEILLADIALLPSHRNAGIGTSLIKGVLSEAAQAGKPVLLHVLIGSPAQRLYERLGFASIGNNGLHILMERKPAVGISVREN